MIIVNICQGHCMSAVRTAKWAISERKEYVVAPHGKAADSFTLGFMNCKGKGLIFFAMAGIQAVIAGHFVVRLRYVLDQKGYEVQSWYCFLYKNIVFVSIVMESDIFAIVRINAA